MKLIISGGGTGGHVYPALAAVQSLTRLCAEAASPLEILWVGSRGGMEQALVERAGLKINLIPSAGLRGKNPISATKGIWTLGKGYRQSREIIRQFKPDALFVTGGYVCAPVTLAAGRAGIPVVIYLPDIEPGLAIKFLSRFATAVAVTANESRQFFKPGQSVVTGYPVRAELCADTSGASAGEQAADARRALGLVDNWPVLLVFGGSRGARSINQAIAGQVESILDVCQIVHVTGTLDIEQIRARRAELPPERQARYHVSAYLHNEMVPALQAADLVVSRAGASVMGEFPAVGVPAILVPYPYAGSHQQLNANYLAGHQAAIIIDDAELTQKLAGAVINLISDKAQLQAMRKACKALAKPNSSDRLAQLILEAQAHGN